MPTTPRLPDRLPDRLAPHAALLLRALDAAVAAALAWVVVQPFGGLADRYPYYAPLGAVIGVSTTVLGSARGAVATVRNLVVGAALGTGVQLLALPEVLALALVVGLGTLLSGSRVLATGATWVVYSSVLVLILGGDAPWEYGAAYALLTSLGALVGIATVAALPPLLLTPGAQAVAEAGATLADQLDDLAAALLADGPPTASQWARRQRDLAPTVQRLETSRTAVAESRRGNWRARGWTESAEAQQERAAVLRRTYPLVEQLTMLLARAERDDRPQVALGPRLRPAAATALERWAALLRVVTRAHGSQDTAEERAALRAAVDHLTEQVRRSARESDVPHLEAAGVATTVRLGLALAEDPVGDPLGAS